MMRNKANSGSISLEASIIVPMFIMLMLLINGLFIMFMGQQIMTNTLVQSAKSLAFDPYSTQRVRDGASSSLMEMFTDIFSVIGGEYTSTDDWYTDTDDLEDVIADRFAVYLRKDRDAAEKLLDSIGVENGIDGLDFSGSKVEDGVLTICLKYNQEYIFNTFGFASFERNITVQVKLFTYNTIS